jgi:hypothetical protein
MVSLYGRHLSVPSRRRASSIVTGEGQSLSSVQSPSMRYGLVVQGQMTP